MGTFTASPDVIRSKGNQIVELAEDFTNNMNKMYATIDKLVNSDYVSPEYKKCYGSIWNILSRNIK